MKYYAGLDIGGTNGRLKIKNADNEIMGEFQAPGCSINTDGFEKSRLRLRDTVLPALEALGLKAEDCQGVCVAASGIDSESLERQCREIFEDMGFVKERILVFNDCEVFLHLSKGASLVVISGTGSICYGRDENQKVYRTGGWNHIVSDEGSGFFMGLKTLQAVGDHMDGRTQAPALAHMVIREGGLDTLEKINDFINSNLFEKSEIAKYSRILYQAALQKEETAVRIHKECADYLYILIKDTLKKLDSSMKLQADLWLWGSVLVKNEIVREMLSGKIRESFPALQIKIPEITALDTALMAAAEIRVAV